MLLYFDGDDVGSALELLLLDGRIDAAAAHSKRVASAIAHLASELERSGAEILFAAGDEVLAEFKSPDPTPELLDGLRSMFHDKTGCTLSAGIGATAFEATLSLRRAKLVGKDRIIGIADGRDAATPAHS